MRLAWLSDLHLNFVSKEQADRFLAAVLAEGPEAVLISGDIGTARHLPAYLRHMEARLRRPIYFVLGNHDYYHGSIQGVRAAVREQARRSRWLTWLPEAGAVVLTAAVGLVGHDGWADGRSGDYGRSTVMMNDYLLIEELAGLGRQARLERLRALGDEAAAHFRAVLPAALERHRRVIAVTHVPPFEEACWHEGRISDANFRPHYVCQAAGEALREAMAARPDRELLVLCGHTHGEGEAQILPNLRVLTAGARYGEPAVQRVWQIE